MRGIISNDNASSNSARNIQHVKSWTLTNFHCVTQIRLLIVDSTISHTKRTFLYIQCGNRMGSQYKVNLGCAIAHDMPDIFSIMALSSHR